MSSDERDNLFQDRQARPDAVVLVADHTEEPAIGYVALARMDWDECVVGNVGLRIHPDWCNRGVGTSVLRLVVRWLFQSGIKAVRMDVAASNAGAIRCYEKVGFLSVGEMWRDAPDLSGVDTHAARYGFLKPHVRVDGETPELRFLLMELGRDR
jgi:RimJ/RimL family protein N-acetyltransferase